MIVLPLACVLLSISKQSGSCEPAWVTEFGHYPEGIRGQVSALASFDDGGGPALYVGGYQFSPDGQPIGGVMKRTGTGWSALGTGVNDGNVNALVVHDDGSGPALYAGGNFDTAGGLQANRIARWDGSQWSTLAGGVNALVFSLATFDDGSGPALYAGGNFTSAGGTAANKVAKWDGAGWSALGSGLLGGAFVNAMAAFDDGTGPALYAGGSFTSAGGSPANKIAKWDGASWSALPGLSGTGVFSLAVFDDGTGPALYAGGSFFITGGSHVARWDGSSWSPVGGGVSFNDRVNALQVFDDGRGPSLFAAGEFSTVTVPFRIARWDGASWSSLGGGLGITPLALLGFDDGTGEGASLFAGGSFQESHDSDDSYLARWQGCLDTLAPAIAHPGDVFVLDALGGPAGEVVTFTVSASDERDPAPALSCTPPSGSLFPPGPTRVTCTATDAAGNLSSASFEIFVHRKLRPR